jgi:hypothetical protein
MSGSKHLIDLCVSFHMIIWNYAHNSIELDPILDPHETSHFGLQNPSLVPFICPTLAF